MSSERSLTREELLARVRALQRGRTLRDLAQEIGISSTFLHSILKGEKPVGKLVPRFFGLRPVVRYEPDPSLKRKR